MINVASNNPKLSIVVGASNARKTISSCLSELEKQCNGQVFEIIVVDNSTDGTTAAIKKNFPDVNLVNGAELTYIPELWEKGIRHSTGEIVALTTAHCVPNENWIAAILDAHKSDYAGIGGAIENARSATPVDWAIYFCRYSKYMLPFKPATVNDFAGDNASYKRLALDGCTDLRNNGFWEPFIHAELKKQGHQLLVTPEIIVYHHKSFTFQGFMNNRFWHGRQYGSDRALSVSWFLRLFYGFLSPLIPAVFLLRISRQVFMKKKRLGQLLISLPILILFLTSWALGEFTGYVWAAKKK